MANLKHGVISFQDENCPVLFLLSRKERLIANAELTCFYIPTPHCSRKPSLLHGPPSRKPCLLRWPPWRSNFESFWESWAVDDDTESAQVVEEAYGRSDEGSHDENDTFVNRSSFEKLVGPGEQDDDVTELSNQGKNRPIAAQLYFCNISYSSHSKKNNLL